MTLCFNEKKLGLASIKLLDEEGDPYHKGHTFTQSPAQVMNRGLLRAYLADHSTDVFFAEAVG